MKEFILENAKPYNFSYYTSRIEGMAEMGEVLLSTPLVYSQHCIELIVKVEKYTVVYTQKKIKTSKIKDEKNVYVSKGKIVAYDNNMLKELNKKSEFVEDELNTHIFSIDYNDYMFHDVVYCFISSNMLSFVVFEYEDMLFCFSRIDDDICNMYIVFNVYLDDDFKIVVSENHDKEIEMLKKIIMNPKKLLMDYEIIGNEINGDYNGINKNSDIEKIDVDENGENIDPNKNRKLDDENDKNENGENIDPNKNKNLKLDDEIENNENEENIDPNKKNNRKLDDKIEKNDKELDSSIEMNDMKPNVFKNNSKKLLSKELESDEEEGISEKIEFKKNEQNDLIENKNVLIKNGMKSDIGKENYYSEIGDQNNEKLQKLYKDISDLNKKYDDDELASENEDIKNTKISNTIKYGKIRGNYIYCETKELEIKVSLDNYKKTVELLKILILNMKMNNFDIMEINSDLDIFIINDKKHGFVIFMQDQVCYDDINDISNLSTLKINLVKQLKKHKMAK